MKIVCFDVKDYEQEKLKTLSEIFDEVILLEDSFHLNFEQNLPQIENADVISVFVNSRVFADKLKDLPALKLIATRSTGFSHIDVDYCKSNNIQIVTVPDYGDVTVAEYAMGLLFTLSKKIILSSSNLKNNIIEPGNYYGFDLFGKTVGVIGTGAIGRQFCRIASGIGMKVLAYDIYPNKELEEKYNIKFVSLDELLANSDIISVHVPSTKDNIYFLDKKEFEKMKDGVVIINTARGEIINTHSLYNALQAGKVAAAGLDVLECEDILTNQDVFFQRDECKNINCLHKTLLNHRLLTMPNVIVTPHVAYDTKEAIGRILDTTINNIKGFFSGKIQNIIIK